VNVDRIDVNEPGDWTGPDSLLGAVDELVATDATVHLEAMSTNAAFLAVYKGDEELRVWVRARPTTRAERRAILAHGDERFRDHIAALLPRALGGRSIWWVPWWKRPVSVWRSWREAVDQARVVLDMREEQ
jgi:hypothetical protein